MSRQLSLIFLLVFAVRLTNFRILWIEEAYPMTAAIQMLHGRLPYLDFWFDKPPLSAVFYLLWGALPGWLLRFAGSVYVTGCAALAYQLGGRYAAWLLAVYLSFGIPSAVMALAPDLLLVAPHLAAIWLAQTGRPWLAGLSCGLALLIHTKGVFVLLAALLWSPNWRTLAGFAALLPIHAVFGAAYWQQVWWWGNVYSSHTFVTKPVLEFVRRTGNWIGFQSAAVLATFLDYRRLDWRNWAWLAIALVSVCTGLRFFPRYYFFLLVPIVVLAGRSLEQLPKAWRIASLALLLIPILRFAPRDIQLARGDEHWGDLALFHDSQEIAQVIRDRAKPEDTLFVWGYRPDIDALSRLKGGTPFLESQPLTCIFADRHLREFKPMQNLGCEARVRELDRYQPTWIVDGLGPSNPRFRVESYYSLRGYELSTRTPSAYLYHLVIPRDQQLDAAVRISP
ncbi:ArnT family glycosyltransferase [Bryobacter aggregatus]|uniref:ArnT family glycosyltransferase n=1 Tax=Bryobacter aggregatus TaxID=360054 RepID=UPI0004E17F93|nr:glycosyltransferase family 87 protein [Bryobacter aggregatus]